MGNTKLLVRLGFDVCLDPFLTESTEFAVPSCFDKSRLSPLNMCAIGWWDETHKECVTGTYLGEQVLYTRNDDGEYDSTRDSFCDP